MSRPNPNPKPNPNPTPNTNPPPPVLLSSWHPLLMLLLVNHYQGLSALPNDHGSVQAGG